MLAAPQQPPGLAGPALRRGSSPGKLLAEFVLRLRRALASVLTSAATVLPPVAAAAAVPAKCACQLATFLAAAAAGCGHEHRRPQ